MNSKPHPECKCEECPFAEENKLPAHRPVEATIPTHTQAIIIGEGPGDVEVDQCRPFVGPTGSALRNEGLAIERPIEWAKAALINATACKPKPEYTDQEMKEAVRACAPFFNANLTKALNPEVPQLNPRPILVAGKYASLALTGKKYTLANKRGFIREWNGTPFILTWHPTYALFRDLWRKAEFLIDLQRWWDLSTGKVTRLKPLVNLNMTPSEVYKHALKMKYVSVDIETTFDGPLFATMKTIGFGWKGLGTSFVWPKLKARELATLAEICCDDRIQKVLMNGYYFDIQVLGRFGFHFNNVFDIRDSRRALVTTSKLSLAHQASLYLPIHPWKEDEDDDSDEKGMVDTDDVDKLRVYNATDTVVTTLVYHATKSEVEWNDKRIQTLFRTHTRLSQIAADMHRRGFAVDEENRRALDKKLTDLHNGRKAHLIRRVGIKGWEGTPDEMRALVFRRHAVKGQKNFDVQDPQDPQYYTNDDMTTCSVDKDSLLQLIVDPLVPDELKDIIDSYWHYHAPEKARMTFVSSEKVLRAIGPDGRLRPEWNSCGTETMRWSCRRPNIMNLSEKKDDESLTGELPNIRQMYRAAPGYVLVHSDWSQQEIRVMEAVSGDEELVKALAQPQGFYNALAIKWFGLSPDANPKKENPRLYKSTKNTYLGSQYAASFPTVFRTQLKADRRIQWRESKLLWEGGFMRTFKGIQKYWYEQQEKVKELGYSEGFILRGRCVYPEMPELSKLVNYPIQRTAGEMAALAMIRIVDELEKRRIDGAVVTILHDAFDIEVKKNQAKEVVELMTTIMEGPWEINGRTRKFPVEVKQGEHWSDV